MCTMDPDEVAFHCLKCRKVFQGLSTRRKHVKIDTCTEYPPFSRNNPDQLQREFASIGEALDWAYTNEWNRYFAVAYSTKANRKFVCNQKTSKNRPFKKTMKVFDCQATIEINYKRICRCARSGKEERCDFNEKVALLVGNLKHSHPMDEHYYRLAKACQVKITHTLPVGISQETVVDTILPKTTHTHDTTSETDVDRGPDNFIIPSSGDNVKKDRQPVKENEASLIKWRFNEITAKMQKKLEDIKRVVNSAEADTALKISLITSLESWIDQIPDVNGSSTFTRVDEKRSHSTFDRSERKKFKPSVC